MPDLTQPLIIKNLNVRNRVFLAPMSGVSDLPFRQRSWNAGAGMVISEMVASAALCTGHNESQMRLMGDSIPQHIVQLAGRDSEWMGRAARIVEECGADMIDINMGCPAKKVTGGYSGAALMRDLKLAMSLIEATLKAVNIPVSVKMRLGWDENTINAPELARLAENAGVAMITVHGRTRMQFYQGQADWDAISRVRDAINIPLIANGDVQNLCDAQELMKQSGADGVMVGRACYGQPWLAGEIAGQPFNEDLPTYIADHYTAMLIHYGESIGHRHARKHIDWYLKKHANGLYDENERKILITSNNPDDVLSLIHEIFTRNPSKAKDMA